MPRTTGTSANRLTIYLIKPKHRILDDIIESESEPLQIGDVGQFIFEASHPEPPSWITSFFGDSLGRGLGILNSSAKAIFIAPIREKRRTVYFAISFGQGRHLLKEGVAEERFGLRVVLNSVERESFRSIDKTTLGAIPKHSREQMSRDVAPAEFGIDIEQDLVSSVTAKSVDQRLGKVITGKDAFYCSAPVNVANIAEFLKHCLARSHSNDYKVNFDWIDQIAEVRNETVEDALNAELVQRLSMNHLDKIWMAVPEVLDWANISGFRYIRPKRGDLRGDLTLEDFLGETADHPISSDTLKSDYIFAINAENDEQHFRWSAFRCMYAEIDLKGKVYILNNGKWYEIARGFSDEVQSYFHNIPDSNIDLPDYRGGSELEYNIAAVRHLGGACCMDQRLITHGGGHNRVEFCDIFTGDKRLIHVKKYGGSSVLSHLFMQGSVSGELLVSDGEFRAKLNRELPRGFKLADPRRIKPDPSEYEIVYAIISGSANPLNIPFFSKVSLRNARRRLASYGYSVTKKKIQKV
jgi:uncharacterized protein (TIGR04141 family)